VIDVRDDRKIANLFDVHRFLLRSLAFGLRSLDIERRLAEQEFLEQT